MRKYLELLNRLWGTGYTLRDCSRLPGSGPARYAILVSGHRRTKAKQHLWESGCEACREEHGEEPQGACFRRHFAYGDDLVKVRLYYALTPYEATGMQCRENIRGAVPAHEQADAYDRLFSLMALDNPDLTMAEFSRLVGHVSPETVSRARRFCRLPEIIREDVAERRMGYGVALELGRLQTELELDETTLLSERATIIDRSLGLKAYKRHVVQLVQDRRSGTGSFFALGSEVDGNTVQRRKVFEQRAVTGIYAFTNYMKKIQPLLESGEMGPDGTWPDTSAINILMRMVEVQQQLIPFLKARLTVLELETAESVTTELEGLLEEIQILEAEVA